MKTRFAICCLILWGSVSLRLHAQTTDCNDPHASPQANAESQTEWESQSSPVYADATVLARDLTRHGVTVECIRRSKEEHLFEGQKGAAWFKTSGGVFEVWFLPNQAAASTVVAQVTARPAQVSLPSGPREFFIQHQNLVFHISMGNQVLASNLQKALQEP
jgi:hypothetical protein